MRFIRAPRSKKESDDFLAENIERYRANEMMGRWAAEEKLTGEFVGIFAIIPINKTDKIQLGYSLLRKNRGKGYASEMTKAGIEYVFNTLRLDVIYAITEVPNLASQKVLLKCGFAENNRRKEEDKEIIEFILFR